MNTQGNTETPVRGLEYDIKDPSSIRDIDNEQKGRVMRCLWESIIHIPGRTGTTPTLEIRTDTLNFIKIGRVVTSWNGIW